MQENKKAAFIITIVLLAIFFPFMIISIVFHVKYIKGNPNHEFHYRNKLWFYDESGSLVGTYDCNYENCGYAQETLLDSTYGINYYKSQQTTPNAFISNRYAIITDTASNTNEPIIYDVVNQQKAGPFGGYKMYFIGLESDYIIIIDSKGKYGVMQMTSDQMLQKIPSEYDYIALQNKKDKTNKRVSIDKFITEKDGKWQLIDATNNVLSASYIHPIVEFDDNNIITKSTPFVQNEENIDTNSDSQTNEFEEGDYSFDYSSSEEVYRLYSYSGSQLLPGDYRLLEFITDNYIGVYTQESQYYIMDARTHSPVTVAYQVDDITKVTPQVTDTDISLIIDGATRETVEIH